ncbi:M56 family metallopeptidase [Verrucomicrobiota bacterium]
MSEFADILHSVSNRVLLMSVQASLLAIIILFALLVFRKFVSPKWRYLLWTVLVLRLVMPWSPQSNMSVFNLTHKLTAFNEATKTDSLLISDHISSDSPSSPARSFQQVPTMTGINPEITKAASGFSVTAIKFLFFGLPLIWLAGVLIKTLFLVIGHYGLARHFARQRPVTDPALLNLLEDCKEEIKLNTPISLVMSSMIKTPALLGFMRPRLLIHSEITQNLSKEEIRLVFLHELAHIKRMDIPVTWIVEVLKTLHWFNPFLWLAFYHMRQERELACDSMVLSCSRTDDSRNYGETLLKFMTTPSRPLMAAGFMGIMERGRNMTRRIKWICSFPGNTNRKPVFSLLLIILLALTGLTNAKIAGKDINLSYAPTGYAKLLKLSGMEEIHPVLSRFAVVKWQQVKEISKTSQIKILPDISKFFRYAQKGDWLASTAYLQKIRQNPPNSLWYAVQETDLAFEQFIGWDEKIVRDYANDILEGMDENTILLAGTDPCRGIVTAFNEVRPESNVIVIAQRNLSQKPYINYLSSRYGDRINLPSEQDIDNTLEMMDENGAETANDILCKQLFELNKDRCSFFVEDNRFSSWMTPHLVPHGLVMGLNKKPIPGPLPDSVVEKDHVYWNARTNELVKNVSFNISIQQSISYSSLRCAIGSVYEAREMNREAEYAYQQARLLCPSSVDVVHRLASLYRKTGRHREALAVLLDLQQHQILTLYEEKKITDISQKIMDEFSGEEKSFSEMIKR